MLRRSWRRRSRRRKLLPRFRKLRLRVGELSPGGLDLALNRGKLPRSGGEILGQLGELRTHLSLALLRLLNLIAETIPIGSQRSYDLFDLGPARRALLNFAASGAHSALSRRLRLSRLLESDSVRASPR